MSAWREGRRAYPNSCRPDACYRNSRGTAAPEAATAAGGASLDADEARKFGALAGEWWKPDGPFAPLHAMNPVRCRFIKDALCRNYG